MGFLRIVSARWLLSLMIAVLGYFAGTWLTGQWHQYQSHKEHIAQLNQHVIHMENCVREKQDTIEKQADAMQSYINTIDRIQQELTENKRWAGIREAKHKTVLEKLSHAQKANLDSCRVPVGLLWDQ